MQAKKNLLLIVVAILVIVLLFLIDGPIDSLKESSGQNVSSDP